MTFNSYSLTLSALLDVESVLDYDYWLSRSLIPIGFERPFEMYLQDPWNGKIPMSEIVCIPFDPVDVASNKRNALNILLLGGSGDGKSLIMKTIWYFLWKAGFYIGYIDPVGTESGRAQIKWRNKVTRLPPYVEPEGIKLKHFMPLWAVDEDFSPYVHNFKLYACNLGDIDEKEMWMGLGMPFIGASFTQDLVKKDPEITIDWLKIALKDIEEIEMTSLNAVYRTLRIVESDQVISETTNDLDLLYWWKQGYSVCISYNNYSQMLMDFDVGMQIKKSARLYRAGNRVPVHWFLDDSADYAKENAWSKFSFSVHEISRIGINYRKFGIGNTLAIQDLKFIDEKIAKTYKFKIISPKFEGGSGLDEINIPREAIEWLKSGQLVKESSKHLMQFIFVDQDNVAKRFFPATPPANHFSEVYFPKDDGEKLDGGVEA